MGAMEREDTVQDGRPSILTTLLALLLLPSSLVLLTSRLLRVFILNSTRILAVLVGLRPSRKASPRKVLITGASTPTGLSTARLLHAQGHSMIAADYESVPYTSCARASQAVHRFYALSPLGSTLRAGINAGETEYFSSNILHVAQHERPDLWIHCGTDRQYPDVEVIAQAKEIVERDSHCKVLHPDTATLRTLIDEVQFAKLVNSMDAGLQAPETRNVFTRGELHRVLGSWPMKRRFILEKLDPVAATAALELVTSSPSLSRRTSQRYSRPVSVHSNSTTLTNSSWSMLDGQNGGTVVKEYVELDALMLPSNSMNDTYDRIASIKISKSEPWSLQEIVSGGQYTAHCLIIQGQLSAFVLTSDERRGSNIVHSGALHDRILDFTHTLAQKLESSTSTHLNVHFVLSESSASKGVQQSLYPVSSDVEANGTMFLHGETASHSSHTTWRLSCLYYAAMPESHPAALAEGKMGNGIASDYRRHRVLSVARPESESDGALRIGYYSLPLSILHLLVLPLLELLTFRASGAEVLRCVTELFNRVAYEKEEYFDWHDVWPWIWFWFVGFPVQTLGRASGYAI